MSLFTVIRSAFGMRFQGSLGSLALAGALIVSGTGCQSGINPSDFEALAELALIIDETQMFDDPRDNAELVDDGQAENVLDLVGDIQDGDDDPDDSSPDDPGDGPDDRPECRLASHCDDGVFCNGQESCVAGICVVGEGPCSIDETCDELNQSCLPPSLCANVVCPRGQFCDEWTGDCEIIVTRLHVDDDADMGGDGLRWETAFDDLQAALSAGIVIGGSIEIWIADGVYLPTLDGDRSVSFELRDNVALIGGFAGDEAHISERDLDAYSTVLSGDLNQDDQQNFFGNSENSYHVVKTNVVSSGVVLDGLVIEGGNASGVDPQDRSGGGLTGSPLVRNCLFIDNSAVDDGGAALFKANEALNGVTVFDGCTFVGNRAGGKGGALSIENAGYRDSVTISACDFEENSASSGGGLYTSSGLMVRKSTFSNNVADQDGGAAGSDRYRRNTGSFLSCRFYGNTAGRYGGAAHWAGDVAGCVFSGNVAGSGGGLYSPNRVDNCTFHGNVAEGIGYGTGVGGGIAYPRIIQNCILWGNVDQTGATERGQVGSFGYSTTITYSAIQGLSDVQGDGNTSLTPYFVDADGLDNIVGTPDDDLRLRLGSAGIDVGENTIMPTDHGDLDDDGDLIELLPVDLDGTSRVKFGVVDMGAYELD